MFLWVGQEMIRAVSIPMFGTGAFIGYTQSTQAWLLQPVAIFSIYGFDFLILLVNYALALGFLAWYDRKYPSAGALVDENLSKRWLVSASVVLVAWIGLSLIMLNSAPKDAPTVRVTALRAGFPLAAHIDQVTTDQVRRYIASQARREAAQGSWSHRNDVDFDPQQGYMEEFSDCARNQCLYLIFMLSLPQT
jgi:apolipoprotein N-acyltransferase